MPAWDYLNVSTGRTAGLILLIKRRRSEWHSQLSPYFQFTGIVSLWVWVSEIFHDIVRALLKKVNIRINVLHRQVKSVKNRSASLPPMSRQRLSLIVSLTNVDPWLLSDLSPDGIMKLGEASKSFLYLHVAACIDLSWTDSLHIFPKKRLIGKGVWDPITSCTSFPKAVKSVQLSRMPCLVSKWRISPLELKSKPS